MNTFVPNSAVMEIKDFVIIRKGKEDSIRRFHPWVFSGALFKKSFDDSSPRWVKVLDPSNRFLALGYYADSSIAVRIVSFEDVNPDARFWASKFDSALAARQAIGFLNNSDSNAFRLINGEGDGVPGLIADVYADTVFNFTMPFCLQSGRTLLPVSIYVNHSPVNGSWFEIRLINQFRPHRKKIGNRL